MHDNERPSNQGLLPYDPDPYFMERLWSGVSAIQRRVTARVAKSPAEDTLSTAQEPLLSPKELQALLYALRDSVDAAQRAMVQIEAALAVVA